MKLAFLNYSRNPHYPNWGGHGNRFYDGRTRSGGVRSNCTASRPPWRSSTVRSDSASAYGSSLAPVSLRCPTLSSVRSSGRRGLGRPPHTSRFGKKQQRIYGTVGYTIL